MQVKEVLLSGVLDVKQLQLKEGQAWKLFLDIYVLDADGCMSDLCLLAAVAALLGLRLPSKEIDEDGKVSSSAQQSALHWQGQECQRHQTMTKRSRHRWMRELVAWQLLEPPLYPEAVQLRILPRVQAL